MGVSNSKALRTDEDGVTRCFWCMGDPIYIKYHDTEWGYPVVDDTRLFEKLCLEGFQSGLSWLTILRKRENFRAAFNGFEIAKVARFGKRDVNRLLTDAGIVRHRGKIESTINNAQRALELIKEFGSLAAYVWQYEPRRLPMTDKLAWSAIARQPTSKESTAMSKDLKRRGWSFVGPTTVQAFMQAMGLVNHHIAGGHVRERAEERRTRVHPPRGRNTLN
jgi:DNA-3-methyladenine glycosylase I